MFDSSSNCSMCALHVRGFSGTSSKNQDNAHHLHSGANAEQQKQEHLKKIHNKGSLHSRVNGSSIKKEKTGAYAQPANGQTVGYSVTRPYVPLLLVHEGSGFSVTSGAESLTPPAPPSLYSSEDNMRCRSPTCDTYETSSSQTALVLTPNSAANMAFGRLSFNEAKSRCTATNENLGNSL